MVSTPPAEGFPDARSRVLAWRALVLGSLAQAIVTIVVAGPAFLIPLLREKEAFSLATAGTAAASTSLGMVFTLVLWGAVADRRGERLALSAGLLACAAGTALGVVLAQAGALHRPLPLIGVLALAGAAGASVNSATGRVVAGWFPRSQRGTAMGARQMAQPLGTAVAAVLVPPLADAMGVLGFFLLTSGLCLVIGIACRLGIVDPPRPARTELPEPGAAEGGACGEAVSEAADCEPTGSPEPAFSSRPAADVNPYRADSFLLRIHAASALLVIPQFAFATFGLVWLMDSQGMAAATAGLVVGAAQLAGAGARFAMGRVSDLAPSRVVVLRIVAWSACVLSALVAAVSLGLLPVVAAIVFLLASAASVADNGLALTSIAEGAGYRWSGKAMGIQNTGQHALGAGVGPALGLLIAANGYPIAMLCVAAAPAAASFLVPRADVERS
ncbi:MFS transporter [Brevibacterium jeotgali]|uniref:Sugar phosphate permease n=1 Tax=Brevibacterium jeotgali TaxID=1262550 RepID=A0A2H1L6P1_9MICO|nr:MFS transporter [Brevibacterium jeotgali]TWB99048.1 sugar phosphate permease [Brevibacterium jeotgali]SMY12445.1 Sugar phosphate permease [Brevibacterium jeotgali]